MFWTIGDWKVQQVSETEYYVFYPSGVKRQECFKSFADAYNFIGMAD